MQQSVMLAFQLLPERLISLTIVFSMAHAQYYSAKNPDPFTPAAHTACRPAGIFAFSQETLSTGLRFRQGLHHDGEVVVERAGLVVGVTQVPRQVEAIRHDLYADEVNDTGKC